MRRPVLAALAAATSLALLAPVTGQATAAGSDPAARVEKDYGGVRNILPPGSHGNATALDVLALGGTTADETTPTNFADQLEVYDALTTVEPQG